MAECAIETPNCNYKMATFQKQLSKWLPPELEELI